MITNFYNYLEAPYLVWPYLSAMGTGSTGMQFKKQIISGPVTYTQVELRVVKDSDLHIQFQYRIENVLSSLHMQALFIVSSVLGTQVTLAIYNVTNLRILYDFPSRGTSGTNWSVIAGGTETGDFSVNNLNTDIVEQVYRATAKTVSIQCDTEISQGIFNDTVAILGHNFTTSAIVLMQGSNDSGFASVGVSEVLDVERENMFWIADSLPLASYRYWRFTITDTTNADNLQIGTIVFGSSIIFSGECFVDTVVRRKTHFADRVRTEGFTSVSNDRALKRAVSLTFKSLNYNRDNYSNLSTVIDEARTSLKCLWIPTPEFPSRFAVFGKLSEIPVETHKVIGSDADYIDLDITVDEAL